jgi:transmembrane sensor
MTPHERAVTTLKATAVTEPSDAEVDAMWQQIDARAPHVSGRSICLSLRARSWPKLGLVRPARAGAVMIAAGTITAAVAALVIVALVAVSSWLPNAQRTPTPSPPGALQRSDGTPVGAPDFSEGRSLVLAEGSRVTPAAGAHVGLLSNDAQHFDLKQSRGMVHYGVTPGGPRRWKIEAPLVTVEVTGTAFDIDADESHATVSVIRGAVIVRGEGVPGHVQVLRANQRIEVAHATLQQLAVVPEPVAPAGPIDSKDEGHSSDKSQHRTRQRSTREPVTTGMPRLSVAAVPTETTETLFANADAERRAGHAELAIKPLQKILIGGGHAPQQKAVAAFSLGRIYMDSLSMPREAAKAFERAISLQVRAELLQDAYVRRVEAWSRAGDSSAKARAIAAYQSKYPEAFERIAPWAGPP